MAFSKEYESTDSCSDCQCWKLIVENHKKSEVTGAYLNGKIARQRVAKNPSNKDTFSKLNSKVKFGKQTYPVKKN